MTGLGYGLKSLKRKLGKAFRELHKIGVKNVFKFDYRAGLTSYLYERNVDDKR